MWDNKMPAPQMTRRQRTTSFAVPSDSPPPTRKRVTKQPAKRKRSKQETQPAAVFLPLTTYNDRNLQVNPYADRVPVPEGTDMVSFVATGHEYTLAGVPDKKTTCSASALLKVWKSLAFKRLVKRVERGDAPSSPWEGKQMVKVEKEIKLFPSDLAPLEQAIIYSKLPWATGSQFISTPPLVTTALVRYLNLIAAKAPAQPMTFKERYECFIGLQTEAPKDFSQFVPHAVFRALETWFKLAPEERSSDPFEAIPKEDMHMLMRMLGGYVDSLEALHDHKLRAALMPFASMEMGPLTGDDVAELYGIAAEAGTSVHSYLEFRLADRDRISPADAAALHPLREPEDYVQVENYISSLKDHQLPTFMEWRGCSLQARICGSMDVVWRLPDGRLQISDYKRSKALLGFWDDRDRDGVCRPKMGEQPPGGDIVKYAIQMAVYSKLLRLSGEEVSQMATLIVFHPLLDNYFLIELDLGEKMQFDKNGVFCDLGVGKYGKDAKTLTPLEFVELVHEELETELKEMLGMHN
jgi:hypothetical protein